MLSDTRHGPFTTTNVKLLQNNFIMASNIRRKQQPLFTYFAFPICFALVFAVVYMISSPIAVFAQLNNNQSGNQGAINLNGTNTSLPILSKISDKGNYQVQIRWGQPQDPNLLPQKGFDMEVLFLNASAPVPTAKTVPQRETNLTGNSVVGGTGYTDPSIIQRLVPIDSFDITIYSNSGKVLWSKVNQAVTAGRAAERVSFQNGYTGGITIVINNIKASNSVTGGNLTPLSTPAKPETTDSVKFTAKVTS
jgi:hypothetical protein